MSFQTGAVVADFSPYGLIYASSFMVSVTCHTIFHGHCGWAATENSGIVFSMDLYQCHGSLWLWFHDLMSLDDQIRHIHCESLTPTRGGIFKQHFLLIGNEVNLVPTRKWTLFKLPPPQVYANGSKTETYSVLGEKVPPGGSSEQKHL